MEHSRGRAFDPKLTISPAIDHLVSELIIDFDALHDFYATIDDKPNKPPLSDAHIHISGANVFELLDSRIFGYYANGPVYSPAWFGVPELDSIDRHFVGLFIGSAVYADIVDNENTAEHVRSDLFSANLNISITHETTHLSQNRPFSAFSDPIERALWYSRIAISRLDVIRAMAEHLVRNPVYASVEATSALAEVVENSRFNPSSEKLQQILFLLGELDYLSYAEILMDRFDDSEEEKEAWSRQTPDFPFITATRRPLSEIQLLHPRDLRLDLMAFRPDPKTIRRYLATSARPFTGEKSPTFVE